MKTKLILFSLCLLTGAAFFLIASFRPSRVALELLVSAYVVCGVSAVVVADYGRGRPHRSPAPATRRAAALGEEADAETTWTCSTFTA